MNYIRYFIIYGCLLLITIPVFAQTNTKIQIAIVVWRGETEAEKGFQSGLQQFGYQPQYHIIHPHQNKDQLADMLRQRLKPKLNQFDYIYTFGTTASVMVQRFLKNRKPQIFNIVAAPNQVGLKKPNAFVNNISGVTHRVSLALQIQTALKFKAIKRIGFFFNPREENSNLTRKELIHLGEKYGFEVVDFRSPPVNQLLQKNLERLKTVHHLIDAVYLPMDSYIATNAIPIGIVLKKYKIMGIGALKEYIRQGALFGIISDYYQLGIQAATIIHRHQNGERLEDIPIQTERNPQLVFNRSMLKYLKIKIPKTIKSHITFLE